MQGPLAVMLTLTFLLSALLFEEVNAQVGKKVDLLQFNWSEFYHALVDQGTGMLKMTLNTTEDQEIFNRAYTNLFGPGLLNNGTLFLNYATDSLQGEPKFFMEMRRDDSMLSSTFPFLGGGATNQSYHLRSFDLENTEGISQTKEFKLPDMSGAQSIQFRLYIISNGPTQGYIHVENATIYGNEVTQVS